MSQQFSVLIVISLLLLSGCSYRAWHRGFIEGQKYQCNKLPNDQRRKCLESINYDIDAYERERREWLQKQK